VLRGAGLRWIAHNRGRRDHTQRGNNKAQADKKKGARRYTEGMGGKCDREHPGRCGNNNGQ